MGGGGGEGRGKGRGRRGGVRGGIRVHRVHSMNHVLGIYAYEGLNRDESLAGQIILVNSGPFSLLR